MSEYMDIGFNMAKEKITIQIDDEVIELKGAELEAFLEQRAKDQAELEQRARLIEAEQTKKAKAKEKALEKLKELGLTDEEINAII
jgi:hypothetical protein